MLATFLILFSSLNKASICKGNFLNFPNSSDIFSSSNEFFRLAINSVNKYKTTNWVVNAFVEATPISGPAYVYKTESDSRSIELPFTFTIDKTFALFLFASLIAANVSAVSPDWEIAMTRVFLLIIGCLYLNSEAYSTSTGIFASSSSINSPAKAECHEVPQATIIRSEE